VQRDDMDAVIEDILSADIVLLASPSYWGDVTGRMKVFIDRCLPLCNAKSGETPVPKGKIGIGVAVRAGQARAENEDLLRTFRHYLGHLGIEMVADLTVERVDCPADLEAKPEKLNEAYRLGMTIREHLHTA
jgi:multimeric flavodoxin WrbA